MGEVPEVLSSFLEEGAPRLALAEANQVPRGKAVARAGAVTIENDNPPPQPVKKGQA